jgi:phosphohistidine phosphatase
VPTLYLLRHAKSSWDSPTLHDHDRPLAPRGIRACAAMTAHMREHDVSPELVICSTAVRTRLTLDGVRGGLGGSPAVTYEARVYEATAASLLEVIQGIPAGTTSAMVIGHQPGIGNLASRLAESGERVGDLERKFPTAALATLELDREWADAGDRCAVLSSFVKPKELLRSRSSG